MERLASAQGALMFESARLKRKFSGLGQHDLRARAVTVVREQTAVPESCCSPPLPLEDALRLPISLNRAAGAHTRSSTTSAPANAARSRAQRPRRDGEWD